MSSPNDFWSCNRYGTINGPRTDHKVARHADDIRTTSGLRP